MAHSVVTSDLRPDTVSFAVALLHQKGVRCSTFIDLGSADGHFGVWLAANKLLGAPLPLNVDPNPIYEPSLRAVKDAVGGEYVIAAAAETAGETMLTTAVHSYWSSLRDADDPYWERINHLVSGSQIVRTIRVDDIVRNAALKPPFIMRLDVQGGEVSALRGAPRVLAETDVVICEADLDDFRAIDQELGAAAFDLFDITEIHRSRDDYSLGWFYPIYLSRRLSKLRSRAFWKEGDSARVIEIQEKRRRDILSSYAEILPRLKVERERANQGAKN